MSRKPLTDAEGEVRELEDDDFAAMRPAEEVLPPDLVAKLPKRLPGQRGPGKKPAKQLVTLRLKPEVIEAYRATGEGWQTRMAAAIESGTPIGTVPTKEGDPPANDSFAEIRSSEKDFG